jgi:hypothetical protein
MKKLPLITIFSILVICLGYTVENRWKGEHGDSWKTTISSDGYGYYAYLPCIFIYHHLDYKIAWDEEKKVYPGAIGFATPLPQNKSLDKWFPGEAILLAPFFLLAYLLSYLMGYSTGGYEFPFEASVSIAALFYLGVGLIFLYKLLKEFDIPELTTCLTLILIVLGTNLFYYSTIEPSMSHVYSFGITPVFLFYTKKSAREFNMKNQVLMVLSISILALIRPTNLLSLAFVPFITGSLKDMQSFVTRFFKSNKSLYLLLIPAGFLFIHLYLLYLQTGSFFVYSYSGEGFNFKEFHFWDILFGYRKGLFVYSPIMFIAISGGLFTIYRQSKFRFLNSILFFVLVTYVLSSWWCWWYGGSFGLRAFIDFYPIFALMLAIFLNSLTSRWQKIPVLLISSAFIGLNFFQTTQYINNVLPYDGMTKEKYWKIFLENKPSYRYLFENPDTTGFTFLSNYDFKNDLEKNTWGNDQGITTQYAHSGIHSVCLNEQNQYSPDFKLKASAIPTVTPLFVYVKLWAYMPNFNNNASIIVSVKPENGDCYLWESRTIQGFVFKTGVWSPAYALIHLPAFKNPTDELNVYVYDTEGSVYIDDMEVTFATPQ